MVASMTAFVHRITISGDPGSGKTTFARAVAAMTGYQLITTGNIFRKLAADRGISITALNELAETRAQIDHEVDDYLKTLNDSSENLVLDSRMAWHFVRASLKVRLTVDPEIAASRIFSDTAAMRETFPDMDAARVEIERRKRSEIGRYRSLYDVDISDSANFDLVLDTSAKDPDDITRAFAEQFETYKRSAAA